MTAVPPLTEGARAPPRSPGCGGGKESAEREEDAGETQRGGDLLLSLSSTVSGPLTGPIIFTPDTCCIRAGLHRDRPICAGRYTHAHTLPHTHTGTRAGTHTLTCIHTQTQVHTHTHAFTHTQTHSYTHTGINTHILYIHTFTHTHTPHRHTHTHMHSHTQTQIHTLKRKFTHTHMRSHTHTHRHTQTHIQA